MSVIRELDTVVLNRDVPDKGLIRGDVGTVVHVYADGVFEMEFVTHDGRTVALLTLTTADIRPRGDRTILHAREYANPPS